MPKSPLMPRNPADPAGIGHARRNALSMMTVKFRDCAKQVRVLVNKLPRESVEGESSKALKSEKRKASLIANREFVANYIKSYKSEIENEWYSEGYIKNEAEKMVANRSYSWQVDNYMMDRTMDTIRRILIDSLLSGDTSWSNRWWLNSTLDYSYEKGTTDSLVSAKLITQGIDALSTNHIAILQAESQLQTPAYLNRISLVHGRVFEEMNGIVGDMVSQLRRVLTDGMARGLGVRDVSGMINDRLGVGLSRSKRIARTELNKAYTDAYMDESEELNENLKEDDYSIRAMHVSALSPTTRKSHALRHGTIHTAKQQRNWWDTGSNRINCLCTVIDVLINLKTGESIQQDLIERTRKGGEVFFKGFSAA